MISLNKSIPIALLIFCCRLVFAQNVNVPVDYWGYDFLKIASLKGIIERDRINIQPISRIDFAKILIQIDKQSSADLTASEKGILERLKTDFSREFAEISGIKLDKAEKHVIAVSEEDRYLVGDLFVDQKIRRESQGAAKNLMSATAGGIVRGSLGKSLNFYVSAWNSATRGTGLDRQKDLNFDASQGLPINITGNTVFQDQALAYFVLEKYNIRLEWGQNELSFGPNPSYSLLLSTNSPPVHSVKFLTQWSGLKITSAHFNLRSNDDKFMGLHRFDLSLGKFFLGLSESVIYKGQGAKWQYLNPIIPFPLVNYKGIKKDGYSLGVHPLFSLSPVVIYMDLYLGSSFIGQDHLNGIIDYSAFSAGLEWYAPLGITDTDIAIEVFRTQDKAYSHPDSFLTYTNYDKYMGFYLGPDTDALILRANYRPAERWQMGLVYQHLVSPLLYDQLNNSDPGYIHDISLRVDFHIAQFSIVQAQIINRIGQDLRIPTKVIELGFYINY
jgi:hypothetical protein